MMLPDWFTLTLIAALFLGIYDVFKKRALHDNAVPPVLLINVSTAAAIWIALLTLGPGRIAHVTSDSLQLTTADHSFLFLKSLMVGSSWILAFFSLKHLPISIAAPIRATSPLWTIGMAVVWLGERPSVMQWCGISLILGSFFTFSRIGRREGILFHRDRWVYLMIGATLVSAFCGLYDKWLLQTRGYSPGVVQAWFSIYLVPVMLPLAGYWYFVDRRPAQFHWRWSIPLIAVFLLLADFAYFSALSDPTTLIAVVSPLRRTSILIAFLYGVLVLREPNGWRKLGSIAALLAGTFLISMQSG